MRRDIENRKLLRLAGIIAVLGDGVMVLGLGWVLLDPHTDQFPFMVSVAASVLNAFNIAAILLAGRIPPQFSRALRSILIGGNAIFMAVLGLLAILSVALLGGGGGESGLVASIEVLVGLSGVLLVVLLNLFLIGTGKVIWR